MITYKIHLIRTGSTSAEPGKRYVGQSDVPLCGRGEESIRTLRAEFHYPHAGRLFTSPLKRCIQTAQLLYPEMDPVLITDFQDMNLGSFEGKSFDELRGDSAFADWMSNSFEHTPPGGEETLAFTERIVGALDDVFHSMMDDKITSAVVVTHGGVIMTLLAAVGLPALPLHQWAVDNGCGYTLLMSTQMWMRDRKAEVFSFIPEPPAHDGREVYGLGYRNH